MPKHSFLICLFAGHAAIAQQTHVVGPGQPFTTIPPAIAAASPGDVVLVLAGTYTLPMDINKGIRLVGRGANLQYSPFPPLQPIVTVHDVPAGETFAMSGFALTPPPSAVTTVRLEVRQCAGLVAIRDLQSNNAQRWSVAVLDCDQVHLASSFLYGINTTNSTLVVERCLTEPTAFSGIVVNSGGVSLVGCTFHGGNGVFGGPGIRILGGDTTITRCVVDGSPGYAAIDASQSAASASIAFDPSSSLAPGAGAPPVSGTATFVNVQVASQAAATDGAVLTVDSHGPPGAFFATFLALAAPQWSTPFGVAWLDPVTLLAFPVAVYDPVTRLHSTALPHPVLPAGIVFGVQAVHFGALQPLLGIPSLLTTP